VTDQHPYNNNYHHVKDEDYLKWAASDTPEVLRVGYDASPFDLPKRAKRLHPHQDFDLRWGWRPAAS
jgi:hypothetical protein